MRIGENPKTKNTSIWAINRVRIGSAIACDARSRASSP